MTDGPTVTPVMNGSPFGVNERAVAGAADPLPFPSRSVYVCLWMPFFEVMREKEGRREGRNTQYTFGNIAAVKLDIFTLPQLLPLSLSDSDLAAGWGRGLDVDGVHCIQSFRDVSELSMHFFKREELKIRRRRLRENKSETKAHNTQI